MRAAQYKWQTLTVRQNKDWTKSYGFLIMNDHLEKVKEQVIVACFKDESFNLGTALKDGGKVRNSLLG